MARPFADHRSFALLTDLYQLTMAYGYWKHGVSERESVFELTFRSNPFCGGYAIACGLDAAMQLLSGFKFSEDDTDYLQSLRGSDDRPLFDMPFLNYLRDLDFSCDLDGVEEGTVVFAHEPLIRIQGPLLQCQLLETALLNVINFQTLIATKAARVCQAAAGDTVLEFGLRRAQGIDGGLAASRAAFVGGCHATSNVLAGKQFGIPVRGTHAHSWVMTFEDELTSFQAYADAMPNNCVFLIDTYDTLAGAAKAAEVGQALRAEGHKMIGVRLDSGDLSKLSQQVRQILDDAQLGEANIVASNDLDEFAIEQLKRDGARIDVWGVGTKLVTAYDQPALGGVYKLAAIREGDRWIPKLKLSEQAIKTSNPGVHQIRRFTHRSQFVGDIIYDHTRPFPSDAAMVEQETRTIHRPPLDADHEDLLIPVFRKGAAVYQAAPIVEAQQRTRRQLAMLSTGVRRLQSPESYPVGLELQLDRLKQQLIATARKGLLCN